MDLARFFFFALHPQKTKEFFPSMRWRSGKRQSPKTNCKCGHPEIAHYSPDGHCVVSGCGCAVFKPSGRLEYRNKRARCDLSHSHDSGTEIKTCFDLQVLRRSGDIRNFQFHELLDLPGPSGAIIATYEIDFTVYHNDGSIEFIECKGRHLEREMGWRLKWALLQDKHKGDPKYKFRVELG